jgi:hypothetical protein
MKLETLWETSDFYSISMLLITLQSVSDYEGRNNSRSIQPLLFTDADIRSSIGPWKSKL